MRTRLDFMPQCVDAFSRALVGAQLQGHFSPTGDGRIEFCVIDPGVDAIERLVVNISFYLFRIHRIEVDKHDPLTTGVPFDYTVTDVSGDVARLPLQITYLNNPHGRLAPVLSVVLGGY